MKSRIATIAVVLALQLFGSVASLSAQRMFRSRCGAGVHDDEKRGFIPLPQGEIFCQLVADPKSPNSFATYLSGDFATIADSLRGDNDTNIASVGLGDSFGLFRYEPSGAGNGIQFAIVGAIFAQFNLDRPSFDLINADYLVGLPFTFRHRGFSGRLQLYHQSSHLGDEFLLSRQPERVNLSFEALELILSLEVSALRLYAGGESFFRRSPNIAVVSQLVHTGAELRPIRFGDTRIVIASDWKVIEQVDWKTAWSFRAGLEIARIPSPGHPARLFSLLGQYYSGPAPYGQFYRDDIRNIGVGFHFSL
ncbi:MAG: DUF1207 domain-containing protein [Longimicrobiales bacterium]